jgi:hypothetical protein
MSTLALWAKLIVYLVLVALALVSANMLLLVLGR